MKFIRFAIITTFSILFLNSCSTDDNPDNPIEDPRIFGEVGTHPVSTYTTNDYAFSTIYYPSDIATMDSKTPLLFFVSGWFGTPTASVKYETLLRFIASHGYTVIYTDEGSTTNEQFCIDAFQTILTSNDATIVNQILPYVDTSKIGSLGHSAGGGNAFRVLDYYSNTKNYGANGRLLMVFDPWFAFGMSEIAMKNLPSNTNVILEKFGVGGNNATDGTDARIPLTEYYLLESIATPKKDYNVYALENADHSYPTGNRPISAMQGILKPLDALLEYTFKQETEEIRVIALENGNDDPYANGNGIQVVNPTYDYPCDGASTLIDYCAIVP